jgi:hypothetical protein
MAFLRDPAWLPLGGAGASHRFDLVARADIETPLRKARVGHRRWRQFSELVRSRPEGETCRSRHHRGTAVPAGPQGWPHIAPG